MKSVPESKYAILGSTGNCGTAVINQLLQRPDTHVNAYCRNSNKLHTLIPSTENSKKIDIFEGSIDDIDLLASCIDGCQAVFLLASTNANVPGCRVSQDLSKNVVAALEKLKATNPIEFIPPKLVLLSSATTDDHLARHMGFFRQIMLRAIYHVYEDLRRTETYLRSQDSWLTTTYIKPGGLSIDVQRGHRLTLDGEETFISYEDLAAGMIEAVGDPSYDGRSVGVVNLNGKAKFAWDAPKFIVFGLVRYYLPFLDPYLP